MDCERYSHVFATARPRQSYNTEGTHVHTVMTAYASAVNHLTVHPLQAAARSLSLQLVVTERVCMVLASLNLCRVPEEVCAWSACTVWYNSIHCMCDCERLALNVVVFLYTIQVRCILACSLDLPLQYRAAPCCVPDQQLLAGAQQQHH